MKPTHESTNTGPGPGPGPGPAEPSGPTARPPFEDYLYYLRALNLDGHHSQAGISSERSIQQVEAHVPAAERQPSTNSNDPEQYRTQQAHLVSYSSSEEAEVSSSNDSSPEQSRQHLPQPFSADAHFSEQTRALYAKHPLPYNTEDSYIRVLDLKDDLWKKDRPLTGSLRIVDISRFPEYAALSYTWGRYASPPHVIVCDGYEVNITITCYEALCSLRFQHGPITIWIDSICIDQSNKREKTYQLPMMGDIYASACPTFVWLGATREMSEAMQRLRVAADDQLSKVAMPWKIDPLIKDPVEQALLRNKAKTNFFGRSRDRAPQFLQDNLARKVGTSVIGCLLNSPWVHRAWTFQELILSPAPVIICGIDSLEWNTFQKGLWVFIDDPKSYPRECQTTTERMETTVLKNTIRPGVPHLGGYPTYSGSFRSRTERWTVDEFAGATSWDTAFPQIDWSLVDARMDSRSVYLSTLYTWRTLFTLWKEFPRSSYHLASPGAENPLAIVSGTHLQARMTSKTGAVSSLALIEVVRALRSRDATEPKDKAFALHSILRRFGVYMNRPSYDKSVGQIYQELFTDLLTRFPFFLNLLLDAGSQLEGAPSWVPDWTTTLQRSWLPSSYNFDPICKGQYALRYFSLEHAENEDSHTPESVLAVHAKWRGEITFCTANVFSDITLIPKSRRRKQEIIEKLAVAALSLNKWVNQWVKEVESRPIVRKEYDPSYQNLLDAAQEIKEAVTMKVEADFVSAMRNKASLKGRPVKQVSTRRYASLFEGDLFGSGCRQLYGRDLTGLESTLRREWFPRHVMKALCSRMKGKRVGFVTDKYVGTASMGIKSGDLIAEVVGVAAPLVLRPAEEGAYRIVGHAFVAPLMEQCRDMNRQVHGFEKIRLV